MTPTMRHRLSLGLFPLMALMLSGCFSAGEPTEAAAQPVKGTPSSNVAPTLQMVSLLADLQVSPGATVQIAYLDNDPDDAALTDLFADIDGDLATTGDQQIVALARPEGNGIQQEVAWSTNGLAPATYHIVARLDDGVNQPVIVTAPGTVTLVSSSVALDTLKTNAELSYDLALLSGTVSGNVPSVQVNCHGTLYISPIQGGRFKQLCQLALGDNAIALTAGGSVLSLNLRYKPSTNRRFVRLVYMLGSDGDGSFDAPAGEPHDQASAVARIKTTGRLLQTFFAEKMNAQGLGRRTFRFETDAGGEPIVRVVKSVITTAQARSLSSGDLAVQFFSDLNTQPSRTDSLDLVVAGTTHFEPGAATVQGNTASFFNGRMAMYGSGTMHTWADSTADIANRWSSTKQIDTTAFLDDSASRKTFWANYATGAGVTASMLAGAFGMARSLEPLTIQTSRNFDQFNRDFMTSEPASATTKALSPILPTQEIGLDRSSSVLGRYHRFFQATDVAYTVNVAPTLSATSTAVTVASTAGVRLVTFRPSKAGSVTAHEEFLGTAPPSYTVSISDLKVRFPGETTVTVATLDDQGNLATLDVTLP